MKRILQFIINSDSLLLLMCIAATVYGIVLISSVTSSMSGSYVTVQIIALILGVGLYVAFSLIDIDIIAGRWQLLYIVSAALISVLFIFGEAGDTGNKAWIRFGIIGIQPAEIVK
ncbi:MAG: FtsW/RodA/SpoVE family cell cycle protein, partial [Oscillospiraceae bacterium]|nr:FtsW/RodA/SpoVE family cell cycle protein [Oscillospiraceae bacterium]